MGTATLIELKLKTMQFFKLYWNVVELGEAPTWSEKDTEFRQIPNFNKRGVYAFVKDSEITYIGVGASKNGTGRYENHGLSKRFNKYCGWVDKPNNIFGVKDERLKDAGAVITLGFEPEHAHLAYALENYLIDQLKPIHNKVGR
ncbi:GIY-YIG nuclease family protein [Acinetobacter indicus]|uniref:hypothetical protein n=1 Tax=Acinetobacter indicus TaxID=756892 RepID=UPI0013639AEE|nr:hypothetical protein [Acinetobacter indicus]